MTRNLDEDAIIGMLARVQSQVTTMTFSDVRTLLRLAYIYGYDEAKNVRLEDIRTFKR